MVDADIAKLESLIVEGVNAIGGQAVKGTIFRFDCSEEGVSVSVNGAEQGVANNVANAPSKKLAFNVRPWLVFSAI